MVVLPFARRPCKLRGPGSNTHQKVLQKVLYQKVRRALGLRGASGVKTRRRRQNVLLVRLARQTRALVASRHQPPQLHLKARRVRASNVPTRRSDQGTRC